MPSTLVVNAPNVVHETIDGETIVIDLTSGTYFSLDGAGCDIWVAIAAGLSEADVAARIQERYEVDAATAERCISDLVQELLKARLLVALPNGANGQSPNGAGNHVATGRPGAAAADGPASGDGPAAADEPAVAPAGAGLAWAEPVLHTYTDMQEFMLVDPIHDVETEAGWPHVREA